MEHKAAVHCILGQDLLRGQGKYKEAEKELRKAIRLEPRFIKAHYYLGESLRKQDKYEEAQKEYLKVIELEPNHIKGICNLAKVLDKQGKRAEAKQYWQRAEQIVRDPNLQGVIKKRLAEKD